MEGSLAFQKQECTSCTGALIMNTGWSSAMPDILPYETISVSFVSVVETKGTNPLLRGASCEEVFEAAIDRIVPFCAAPGGHDEHNGHGQDHGDKGGDPPNPPDVPSRPHLIAQYSVFEWQH